MSGRALVGALLVLLVAAPQAMGGTAAGRLADGRLAVTFRAAPGERNYLRLLPHPQGIRIFDAVPIMAGEGCRRVSQHDALCGPAQSGGIGLVAYTGDDQDSAYVRIGSAWLGPGDDFGVGDGTTVHGGAGDDRINGFRSSRLYGGAGEDILVGWRGDDLLKGGLGRDQIAGGHGKDKISAGPGNDFIRATDGDRDEIRCGSGRDRAFVSRGDRTSGCERVALGWPG